MPKGNYPLQLSFSPEFNRFVLRDPNLGIGDESFEMVIDHPYQNEYHYHFLLWEDGDWQEMISKTDMGRRVADIVEHEGEEVANIWFVHQEAYTVVQESHPAFKMQRKWEAMLELNLFDIPVNHSSWQGKPLSEEALQMMSDARDKWHQENADAMAEAMQKLHGGE